MIIVMKAIKAKKMRVDEVRLELLNALRAEGREHKRILQPTTATWHGEKPKFESLISLQGDKPTVLTGPSGNEMGIKKWTWLDEGTRVRRAIMSRDWRSKTRRGWLGSGGGRGRVVFISRRVSRPGIQARGWSKMVETRRRVPFRDACLAACKRGVAKAMQ